VDEIVMLADIKGIVRNLNIGTETYLPVFEAIVNSIQAIDERNDLDIKNGEIKVLINRGSNKKVNNNEKDDTIIGFEIHDNGCGFDEKNFSSFQHYGSTHKFEVGGKGVGRFVWLKAFKRVEIESVFVDNNVKKKRYIEFTLDNNNNNKIKSPPPVETTEEQKTVVKLMGLKREFRDQEKAYKTTEKIAQRILEHCLSYYVSDHYPKILVESEKTVNLNTEYNELKKGIDIETLEVNGVKFDLIHVIMRDTIQDVNKFLLCAHNRTTSVFKIDFLSNTSLFDNDKKCYYSAYILGNYLDENVSTDRIGFRIPDKRDLDVESFPVTIDMLLSEVGKLSKTHLMKYMEKAEQIKRTKLDNFVSENPFLRTAHKYYSNDILSEISPDSSEEKINELLYKYKGQAEHRNKKEVKKILEKDPRSTLIHDTQEVFEQLNELQKDNLVHYVIYRKQVLDLFKNKLKLNAMGEYNLEKDIHNIIFPQKTDSDSIDYDRHNLWLIDEALTFYNYAASDKALNTFSDSESKDRPDIIIFSEVNGDGICESVSIIELKRPQTDDKKIIDQLYDYIENIKNSKIKRQDGMFLKIRDFTKFFCYALCDFDENDELNDELINQLNRQQFKRMRNGVCYYKYNEIYNAHIEVLSYDWVVRNADQRLKIYLEKLGL